MATLEEKNPPEWVEGIYRLERTDHILGGEGGTSNIQAQELADRTAYLKKEVDTLKESTGSDFTEVNEKIDTNTAAIAAVKETADANAADIIIIKADLKADDDDDAVIKATANEALALAQQDKLDIAAVKQTADAAVSTVIEGKQEIASGLEAQYYKSKVQDGFILGGLNYQITGDRNIIARDDANVNFAGIVFTRNTGTNQVTVGSFTDASDSTVEGFTVTRDRTTGVVTIATDGVLTSEPEGVEYGFVGNLDGTARQAIDSYYSEHIGTSKDHPQVGSDTEPVYVDNTGTITKSIAVVGSSINPVYMTAGKVTASSETVGAFDKPVYLKEGKITQCGVIDHTKTADYVGYVSVGGPVQPVYVNEGQVTAISRTVGDIDNPVYLDGGQITASTKSLGSETKPIYMEKGFLKETSTTVGSTTKPVYMNAGSITESNATVGSSTKPVYMQDGTISATSATVGSSTKPVYLSSGNITAFSASVGSNTKPVYMSGGAVTASTASVGNSTTPVYMTGGTVTACSSMYSAFDPGWGKAISLSGGVNYYVPVSGWVVQGSEWACNGIYFNSNGHGTLTCGLRVNEYSGNVGHCVPVAAGGTVHLFGWGGTYIPIRTLTSAERSKMGV